jgi:hypothetical protein
MLNLPFQAIQSTKTLTPPSQPGVAGLAALPPDPWVPRGDHLGTPATQEEPAAAATPSPPPPPPPPPEQLKEETETEEEEEEEEEDEEELVEEVEEEEEEEEERVPTPEVQKKEEEELDTDQVKLEIFKLNGIVLRDGYCFESSLWALMLLQIFYRLIFVNESKCFPI